MCFPGWTWEYVAENMTMLRWNAMCRHWTKHPPIHTIVAGLAGYRPPPQLSLPAEEELPEFED